MKKWYFWVAVFIHWIIFLPGTAKGFPAYAGMFIGSIISVFFIFIIILLIIKIVKKILKK